MFRSLFYFPSWNEIPHLSGRVYKGRNLQLTWNSCIAWQVPAYETTEMIWPAMLVRCWVGQAMMLNTRLHCKMFGGCFRRLALLPFPICVKGVLLDSESQRSRTCFMCSVRFVQFLLVKCLVLDAFFLQESLPAAAVLANVNWARGRSVDLGSCQVPVPKHPTLEPYRIHHGCQFAQRFDLLPSLVFRFNVFLYFQNVETPNTTSTAYFMTPKKVHKFFFLLLVCLLWFVCYGLSLFV